MVQNKNQTVFKKDNTHVNRLQKNMFFNTLWQFNIAIENGPWK